MSGRIVLGTEVQLGAGLSGGDNAEHGKRRTIDKS